MATRTRMAGSTSVQYEDFVPKYEWKEEQGANVLHVRLPDFQKDQMKITYVHSSRTIRVLGERQVTDYKWKRFNQVFQVPQNCEVSQIQGRFQEGVLIITMPKTVPTQPVPREEAKTSKETSTPSRTAPSPKTSTPDEPKAGKVLDETAGFASQRQKDGKKVEESSLVSKEASKESKSEKGQDDASRKVSADTSNQKPEKASAVSGARVVDQTEKRNKEEAKEAAAAAAAGGRKPLLEHEETSKKRKESEELDKNAGVRKFGVDENKPKKDSIVEKVKGVKDAAAASAKKTVKGFNVELSEERKSMVNMGVAVLVIVAVGAYIAYSFRSSGNNTDKQ